MTNIDDPTATYRGYRRQALYVLFRLFDQGLPSDSKIQPEGEEDLAIFDRNNQLLEVIQVKDLSVSLSVSSFKRTFFERITKHCDPNTDTKVSIISFGPVGPEIEDALEGDPEKAAKVASKLMKSTTKETVKNGKIHKTTIPGLTSTDANNVVSQLKIHKVSEPNLRQELIKRLKLTVTGTDASSAFDFLMWWMLTCSENQRVISRELAIAKLNQIGKFLSARAAHHNQWNRSIIPIVPVELTARQQDRLEESFYRGGRVRFDHIEAGYDVPRGNTTSNIHAFFEECNTIVLHSASGQGKTTQAYRYAKDFVPREFRFEVLAPDDLAHARDMALAIVGHSESLEVPTFVYVDVRPGDQYWVELVRELVKVDGIRILITIREEDWARTAVSAADFDYKELTLSFEENEATKLYDSLLNRGIEAKHLDFHDAWDQFGERKTLFEFVYFITQHESLADRIRTQVTAIERDIQNGNRSIDELDFLRDVAVASAYEARVDLASLLNCYNLLSANSTISSFEEEYLIRVSEDGKYVEGFHAIRSEIITQAILDPVICPWHQIAKRVLPHIVEEDLESFLLCAFSRRTDASRQLINALSEYSPTTWVGFRNILVALMWYGLQSYANDNLELLEEVHQKCVGWWSMALDWDLAMAKGSDGFNILENLGEAGSKANALSAVYRSRQTNKSNIFEVVREWFGAKQAEVVSPTTPQEWLSMAEVLFWLGHLSIKTQLTQSIDFSRIGEATDMLNSYQLGRLLLGVRTCFPDDYSRWLDDSGQVVRDKIRSEAAFVVIQESANEIVGHFVIDPEMGFNSLKQPETQSKTKATIHDVTTERVEILAQVFPEKKRYGAIGYGHRSSFIPAIIDEANKPGVLVENLYPPWVPAFNAKARGYVELYFRPETWNDYFANVSSLRQTVIDTLVDLETSVKKIARQADPPREIITNIIAGLEECNSLLKVDFLLPKVAVDEWGFVSDSSSDNALPATQKTFRSAIERFSPVKKSFSEYRRTLKNFMDQSSKSITLISHLRSSLTQAEKETITKKAAELGVNENIIRLSVVNGINSFKAVLDLQLAIHSVFPDGEFPGIDQGIGEKEQRVFDSTITNWCNFVSPPRVEIKKDRKNKGSRKKKGTRKTKRVTKLGDLIDGTRNRLKSELQSLKKLGVTAHVLSESIQWEGRSALWIGYEVRHPVEIMQFLPQVWDRLVNAFKPDRENNIRSGVINLFWDEIILVPTALRKSLDGFVMPHLKVVAEPHPPSIEAGAWSLMPIKVDDDTLQQLGLAIWPIPPNAITFQRLINSYTGLFQALDHLSDLNRIDVELDENGKNMFQTYLDEKEDDVTHLLNSTAEALNEVSKIIDSCGEIDSRPNLKECKKILVDAKDKLIPPQASGHEVLLTISQILEWKDNLYDGLTSVGIARYFWLADILGFGEWLPSE